LELEEIEQDGYVDRALINEAYRYISRLQSGVLKDSDALPTRSCRFAFEIPDVLQISVGGSKTMPTIVFAGSLWEVRLTRKQSDGKEYLKGYLRRKPNEQVENGPFRNANLIHKIKYRFWIRSPTRPWSAKEQENSFRHTSYTFQTLNARQTPQNDNSVCGIQVLWSMLSEEMLVGTSLRMILVMNHIL